ncbi:PH domain-containing protein [Actinoplanes aureus]|uniref:PH domain-containing protein n=1 Tax=Actinoplanes aureus TaxID=2792083 RepID=A0A931C899_9ACTN|nr:PH domain-containing protein [Actinoplanes aureus]MBG0565250.1 PH domain-containing protein [Actinoplanes aureus]
MGENWIRPYPPGTGRWLVIGWEAAALAFLTWATVQHFDLIGHGVRAVAGLVAALWVIGTWRILQHGVYVSADGVLIRGLMRSRVLRWREIAGVHLHRATHRVGPWKIESGMTVLIERHDGATVNTELWAQGVDFHSRPKLFRAVYQEIRNRHLASAR